jgi:hypothetical protein
MTTVRWGEAAREIDEHGFWVLDGGYRGWRCEVCGWGMQVSGPTTEEDRRDVAEHRESHDEPA